MEGIEINSPDQFYEIEFNAWMEDLRIVADEFTKDSKLSFTSPTDLSNYARRWEDGDKSMDLVLHVERDPKTGEHLASVLILHGITFQDFFEKVKEGKEIDHWERDGVFFLPKRRRNTVLKSIKKELPISWGKADTLQKIA